MLFEVKEHGSSVSGHKRFYELSIYDKLSPWSFVALSNYLTAAPSSSLHNDDGRRVLFTATSGDLFCVYEHDGQHYGVQVMSDGTVINTVTCRSLLTVLEWVVKVVNSDIDPDDSCPEREALYSGEL